jgi:proteasome lid subunit RPN8/RPN11
VLRIPRAELDRLRAHGEEAFPEEACGFLLGSASPDGAAKRVVHARPARNEKRDERTRRYLIAPEQLLAAEQQALDEGLDVVGFYHSHPTGIARPSAFDRAHAWPWYSYVVVGVLEGKAGAVTSWRLAEDRSAFAEEPVEPLR